MELLGPSLGTLLELCGKKFSLKTTIMVADQIVTTRLTLDLAH